MKIKTDTLHYKVYELTYTTWNRFPPEQTNLCQYVRRLAFAPLSLLAIVFILAFAYTATAVRAVFAYPFGYTTNWKDAILNERSPGLFQVKGFHFYPGYVLLPIALVALNYFIYRRFPGHQEVKSLAQVFAVVAFVFEIVLVIVGLFIGGVILFTSDTWDLITEYFHAKTEGVCPLVEFEEDDNGDQ